MCICIYIYIYRYIGREREREITTELSIKRASLAHPGVCAASSLWNFPSALDSSKGLLPSWVEGLGVWGLGFRGFGFRGLYRDHRFYA